MADETNTDQLTVEYDTLQKNLEEKMKTIRTRNAYNKFMDERKQKLEALLKKVEGAEATDPVVLLKGKLLLDIGKYDAALEKFEALIKKESSASITAEAAFGKVRILLKKNNTDDALALFSQIEDKIKKDTHYLQVLYGFGFSAADVNQRISYSKKFIEAVGDDREFEPFKGHIYENLAAIEKEKGNLKKAIEILEKAVGQIKSPRAKKTLESSLKQMKMLNNPAPEINAEHWINSKALTLSALKGKAVIIDFWATWCSPCLKVIPILRKTFNQYKDKGLMVIGFTRVYGSYSDDIQSKGKVSADEERTLIKEFIERHKITYPIAVADGGAIFDAYNISFIPTMILIDKNGNIHDIELGAGDERKLEAKINDLLK
jgi:thiol-disulfide isomerase/thioredoxin